MGNEAPKPYTTEDAPAPYDSAKQVDRHRLRATVTALEEAREALREARDVFEQTHANHCGEAWTSRGLHAPECLQYMVAVIDRALAGGGT